MLTDVYIENYTVVDRLQLTLNQGLSVISGETGAGKSIIVDAVSLALGARADSKIIRKDQSRCMITLCFDIRHIPTAIHWLEQQGLDHQQECIITRIFQQEGRSKITINGKPCSSLLLRELSSLLLIIHSQHQSQIFLQREAQQHYVDAYGKHEPLLTILQKNYAEWRQNQTELKQLQKQAEQRDEQLALLYYQIQELEKLDLQANEWHELHQEHQQLHNIKHFLNHLNQAIDLTIENEHSSSALILQHAIDQLQAIDLPNAELANIIELLNTAVIHIQEAGNELVHYRNKLDLSPQRLQHIEQRLTAIHDLARKHHVSAEELPAIQKSLQQKIQQLEACEEHIINLQQHNETLLKSHQQITQKLTQARQAIAKEISQKITKNMQHLGMKGGEFEISFENQDEVMTPFGNEKIIFLVKTNPGQTLEPLAKIVSGGELSRLSLALQTLISEKENTPTFIFDEVDVGIGGATAEIVGKLLKKLGRHCQILCITHLPQVAAQGDHHYKVSKISAQNNTTASIELLTYEQRIKELARMLSGSKITQQTLQHAEQLLT